MFVGISTVMWGCSATSRTVGCGVMFPQVFAAHALFGRMNSVIGRDGGGTGAE